MCYTAQFLFLYDGLWWKWLFTLKNVSKNDWKLIIGRVGIKMSWVEQNREINNRGVGGGAIIRDSRVCDMIRTHSLLVILPIFFSAFSLIHFMSTFFSRKRLLYRGHRILCPAHHLGRTDNKSFGGFIGSRYISKSGAVAHQGWVARFSPRIPLFS